MTNTEEPLGGGGMTPVVRIGATVRRPVRPATPAIHALLGYLEEVGFPGAPRVRGIDAQGRGVLTFIEGEAGSRQSPPGLHDTATIVAVA